MSMFVNRSNRWRRALAVGAAMTLPLSVAACADDENDDPEIINEDPAEQTPGDVESPTVDPTPEDGMESPEGDDGLMDEDDDLMED